MAGTIKLIKLKEDGKYNTVHSAYYFSVKDRLRIINRWRMTIGTAMELMCLHICPEIEKTKKQ